MRFLFATIEDIKERRNQDSVFVCLLSSLKMAAASSTSMAATAVFMHRLPATKLAAHGPAPALPLRRVPTSLNLISWSRSSSQIRVRASSSDESSPIDANEIFTDLKEKWDAVEDKSTALLYGGGAIVALWLATIVVGAINSVPLLPKLLELIGLGYTGWFVYRYLLYKSSRKELVEDIEALKKKISGVE